MVLRQTKFRRPSVPKDLIIRPRLIDMLNQGVSRPVTLISAPAGYGKSVLASSFLQTCPLPSAWLVIDEHDNDLRVFMDHVLAALDALFPGSVRHTQSLVASTSLPPVPFIADSLLNDLTEFEREFILVLEDLHVLHSREISTLLAELLRHPLPWLHLLLVTRKDPPLALGTLRAYDQLTEIRTQDLRFTAAETTAFMDRAVSGHLRDETLAALNKRTEGWAVGLRLAALMLRAGGDPDHQLAQLNAENRFVMDYLMSEGLAHLPPEMEDFLVRTSILDQLCGPLCDAILATEAATEAVAAYSQAKLQWLEDANLFTICLDEERLWYRYHHLFHGFLRNRLERTLSADAIATLHLRAGAWYASQGRIEEALQHALAAGETQGAVQLVAQHRHHVLNTEQRPRLERWLRLFPAAAIAQHPDLLLAKAWGALPGRIESRIVLERLDQAQALIAHMIGEPQRARQLQGELETLRSIAKTFAANDPQGVITLATRALETMPREWYRARSTAWLHLAVAYQMCGQLDRAYAVLATGQREDVAGTDATRARNAGANCFIDWLAADLPGLMRTGQYVVGVSRATLNYESLSWGHYFLANVFYQRNQLAAAELHANLVQEHRYASDPIVAVQSACLLAAIQQARGRPEAARPLLDRAQEFLVETHSEALLPLTQAFGAELAARQGDLATAREWAVTAGPLVRLALMALFYVPQLTLPKVLLAMNTPASRQQAAAALSQVQVFVAETHNTRVLIDVLALQALLGQAEGNMPAALQTLEQALLLAQPGGFLRAFVDLGPAMAGLLEQLPRQGPVADFAGQIAQAFTAASTVSLVSPQPHSPTTAQGNHFTSLTDRELEVLELLPQQLSGKEIARRLGINSRTVERHCTNIYAKLGVHSRRKAVALARRLSLIQP